MRTFVLIVSGLLLGLTGSARAHIASGSITLTVAEETPAPVGAPAGATGTADIELDDDNTIVYTVQVANLSGPALAAHIHEGAPGVPGGIIFTLTKTGDTTFAGTTAALTADQVSKLLRGDYYVNVHTVANTAGEIRGQIFTPACSCKTLSKKDFKSCVNAQIKTLEKEQKKTAAIKALKKAVKKGAASCAGGAPPKKKQGSCCLTTEASYIVAGQLCQPVKSASQCKGGTFVDSPCSPNPCPRPASPSGAFVE
jgi:hypothetical protein